MKATATFFFLSNLKKTNNTGRKIKPILDKTRAKISILVYMIGNVLKTMCLITIVTIQTSSSTFNIRIKTTDTWIVPHIFIRYYAIHKR